MPERVADLSAFVTHVVDGQADSWDRAGVLPVELLRELGGKGVLCAEVPTGFGGLGLDSGASGELTAHVGSLCGSLHSIMTSQGMAAWTIQRLGTRAQQSKYLPELTSGVLAAVGFSEPAAGSDLSAMRTRIHADGDSVVIDGHKVWVTGAQYADLLVVVGQGSDGAAAVVVPSSTPGVRVDRVPDPLGCRAAGHANVWFDSVRVPADAVLGGGGLSLSLLVTTALAYGSMSVAWGCLGILRACLAETVRHTKTREQFGVPLARHQLVAEHLAELMASEQVVTRACEHASTCSDSGSPEMIIATVLAKSLGARLAARGAATAVQLMGSAGAHDGHPVARAYRDAKMMEIIEGTNEICLLMLAEHASTVAG